MASWRAGHVQIHPSYQNIITATAKPRSEGKRPRRKFKVLEIFSWAMVLSTLALGREGWTAGPVCSIETGFDLTTTQGQTDAWQLLENEDPDVVTVAWPCTDWSLIQNLNLFGESC